MRKARFPAFAAQQAPLTSRLGRSNVHPDLLLRCLRQEVGYGGDY